MTIKPGRYWYRRGPAHAWEIVWIKQDGWMDGGECGWYWDGEFLPVIPPDASATGERHRSPHSDDRDQQERVELLGQQG